MSTEREARRKQLESKAWRALEELAAEIKEMREDLHSLKQEVFPHEIVRLNTSVILKLGTIEGNLKRFADHLRDPA